MSISWSSALNISDYCLKVKEEEAKEDMKNTPFTPFKTEQVAE